MSKHILSLRFDGLEAAREHGIGTAGSKQVVAGAQMLLGAHAYYYTSGKVPDRVDDHAAGFQILDTGRRQGSVIYDFAVAISASAIWDLMKAYYGFDSFLAQSYVAYRAGRLFDEPPYSRTQLSLAARGANSTLIDASYVYDRRRLLQRTRQAMSAITAPLGITASVVNVSIDGNHLDNITSRLASGENIDEWLQAYRAAYGRPLALM